MTLSQGARPRAGVGRWTLRILGWLLVVLLLALIVAWFLAKPPQPGAFYNAPAQVPASAGVLIKAEPFTRGVPAGVKGWRILYTTTRPGGKPAVASALVLASSAAFAGPRPVIAWAHGTTGIEAGCAPSLMTAPFGLVPALEPALAEGWVVVATDYTGLGTAGGHAYLDGDDEARAVLDSVRAARGIKDVAQSDQAVVWGHSQGGGAALWTGIAAPAYAPDVKLVGVAAFAPASDLPALAQQTKGTMFGKIVASYMLSGFSAAYADVKRGDYAGPWSALWSGDMAGRCLGEAGTLLTVAETKLLPAGGIYKRDPTSGPLGARLTQNIPDKPIIAPVLIAQGRADDLVLPGIQTGYVTRRCAAGQPIDYRTYPGRDHISLVTPDSPLIGQLMAWTEARFAGQPAAANCPAPSGLAGVSPPRG
jgi:pimeloyl-ACP methyl ester carboxylesterase